MKNLEVNRDNHEVTQLATENEVDKHCFTYFRHLSRPLKRKYAYIQQLANKETVVNVTVGEGIPQDFL